MAMVMGFVLVGLGIGFIIAAMRAAIDMFEMFVYAQNVPVELYATICIVLLVLGLVLLAIGILLIVRSMAKAKKERQKAQEERTAKGSPAVCPTCGNNLAEGCTKCPFCG